MTNSKHHQCIEKLGNHLQVIAHSHRNRRTQFYHFLHFKKIIYSCILAPQTPVSSIFKFGVCETWYNFIILFLSYKISLNIKNSQSTAFIFPQLFLKLLLLFALLQLLAQVEWHLQAVFCFS